MTFTPTIYLKFKSEYLNAVKNNVIQFKFEGHDFLTDYAKYVLEYLKPKFEN